MSVIVFGIYDSGPHTSAPSPHKHRVYLRDAQEALGNYTGPRHLVSLKIAFTFCLISIIKITLSQIDINHMILPEQDQGPVMQWRFAEADMAPFNPHK